MASDVRNQDRRGASDDRSVSIGFPPRNAAPKRTADQEVSDDSRRGGLRRTRGRPRLLLKVGTRSDAHARQRSLEASCRRGSPQSDLPERPPFLTAAVERLANLGA